MTKIPITKILTKEYFKSPSPQWLCCNSVHGSRASPRTDYDMLKINHLAVRPERVEGRMANYDTVSPVERGKGWGVVTGFW